MLHKHKLKILLWLPLMKELERMGHDPVRLLFSGRRGGGGVSAERSELFYRALTICKSKYPRWYAEASKVSLFNK